MTKAGLSKFWQLGLANSLIIGGAIALSGEYVLAQIQPDSALSSESSVVNSVDENIDRIDGGAIRSNNLLHSFQEFNVGEGKAVYFANPQGIENIFSRVTGNNPSQIQGVLGVLGTANLFLLNPNGIIFGTNASLDVNGSFVATTANSILFQDGQEFSAINPQKPILEIKVPLGLQIGSNPGAIVNRSQAPDSSGQFVEGFQVNPGKNLALIGGDVSIEGGVVAASGGRIELGGLSTAGTVNLNGDGSWSFPDGVARGNVSLNRALVDVSSGSEGRGSLLINAKNLELKEGSALGAGIISASIGGGLGSPDTQAEDVLVNATDKVTLDEFSRIYNSVFAEDVGKPGNIEINTTSLSLTNGSRVSTSTFGKANAGVVTIKATDISADGVNDSGFSSGIFSTVEEDAIGNSGGINITTGSLNLTNGAQVNANTLGQGNTGKVTIRLNRAEYANVR